MSIDPNTFTNIGMAFEKYPINFPVDNKLTILIGVNGSGKTTTLFALEEYYKKRGDNVLFFKENRLLDITFEDVENFSIICKLTHNEDIFKSIYHINLDLLKETFKYHRGYIRTGILQIVNFFCTINKQKESPIVLIDFPETNLDINYQHKFLENILEYCNIKSMVVATHSPEIISIHTSDTFEMNNFLKL